LIFVKNEREDVKDDYHKLIFVKNEREDVKDDYHCCV